MNSRAMPGEIFLGEKLDVSHLRIFDCVTYMHVLKKKTEQIGIKNIEVFVIGI